jgi:hypothetical protein
MIFEKLAISCQLSALPRGRAVVSAYKFAVEADSYELA